MKTRATIITLTMCIIYEQNTSMAGKIYHPPQDEPKWLEDLGMACLDQQWADQMQLESTGEGGGQVEIPPSDFIIYQIGGIDSGVTIYFPNINDAYAYAMEQKRLLEALSFGPSIRFKQKVNQAFMQEIENDPDFEKISFIQQQ